MAIAPGTKLGQYEILGPLGSGGMGEVYRARDSDLRREVAIKVLPEHLSSNNDLLKRFESEARLASSLNHPNIVTIYAIGVSGTTRFTVMELVRGRTLSDELAEGPMPIDRILQIAIQIVEGLSKAHEAGVIHRDLKPQNIMLTPDGLLKIVDFGLSKTVRPPGNPGEASTIHFAADTTAPGVILGTVDYMSPEQAAGRDVDFHSDQFSLGSLLYEMISGKRPFRHPTAVQTLAAIIDSEPMQLKSVNSATPARLEALVRRCMDKDPAKRYASTAEIARDLKDIQGSLVKRMRSHGLTRKIVATGSISLAITAAAFFGTRIPNSFDKILHFAPAASEQQVAVLPFANIGGDPASQAFCDGLVEVLTSKLTQLQPYAKGLHIVPATEIRSEKITSARDALKSFGANVVVTGSMQRGPEKVRLTINVIDSKTMRQLQAASIDAELHDVSVMQDGIVIRVAELLGIRVDGASKESILAGGTTEPSAYDFYVQGRGYLQRFEQLESVDQAIDLFRRATTYDPQYTLAHAALGEAYWRKYAITKDAGLVREAQSVSEKALAGSQNIAGAHFTLALIDAGAGRYEAAVGRLQRALAIDPVNTDYYRELALDYREMGRDQDAIAAYNKAITLQPNSWAGYNGLGALYFVRARYSDAETQFRKAISLTPDNARAYRNLGAALHAQHRYDEAAKMFEKSASLQPSDNLALSNLGATYFMLGRYGDSARTLERALAINDKNYRTWLNFAEAQYWAPGGRDKALAAYEQAAQRAETQLKLNPRQGGVLADLANMYSRTGKAALANDLVRKALEASPEDVEVIYQTGSVYEQLGDRKRALELIGRALAKGYSIDLVRRSPTLTELRKDPQFASIQPQNKQ